MQEWRVVQPPFLAVGWVLYFVIQVEVELGTELSQPAAFVFGSASSLQEKPD